MSTNDHYENFRYVYLAQNITPTDTVWSVDHAPRLPDPGAVNGRDVWLTVDDPGAFEVVKLLSRDELANTITVVRGQDATAAHPHDAGLLIKCAITAGMLARLAGR